MVERRKARGQLIHLHQARPQEALQHLNRLTGLRFHSWPQSLLAVEPDREDDLRGEPAEGRGRR